MKLMKSMMLGTALVAATVAAAPTSVRASDDDGSTSVTLSADARRTVEQDRVTATLSYEFTGKTAEEVQAKINTKMQAAKPKYDAVGGIKVSTGGYNVYKNYPPEPEPKADGTPAWTPEEREKKAYWQGNQQLIIDGTKSDDMLQLIGGLQKDGFALQGLNFYMSRDAEDAVKDSLIAEALANIQARAENIRKSLGMKKIRYAKIDLGDNGRPIPMMRSPMAMKAEAYDMAGAAAPAPVAEAGETEVVVNVTAEVKLK